MTKSLRAERRSIKYDKKILRRYLLDAPEPVKLSKPEARRALVRRHFTQCATQMEAFERLRSIQVDPIAPCGCSHDLVLQSRVPGYCMGDWEKLAYEERLIYDGWDKQACLIPFEGWPVRRVFRDWFERSNKIVAEHPQPVVAILRDLDQRGPLQLKEFGFQARKDEWEGSWYGPSITKQVLRALWNTGRVMTAGRRRGQHLYDLAERIVPPGLYSLPMLDEESAIRE